MTEATIVTLVSAILGTIPPTLMAFAALRQGQLNSLKQDTANDKTDSLTRKAEEIHTLANSNLSKVTTALEVANEKIIGLQKMVSELGRRG